MIPARVSNVEEFWDSPPPEKSRRCLWWEARIERGFRPNKRIRTLGYYAASEFYGVYIWEYQNILAPMIRS